MRFVNWHHGQLIETFFAQPPLDLREFQPQCKNKIMQIQLMWLAIIDHVTLPYNQWNHWHLFMSDNTEGDIFMSCPIFADFLKPPGWPDSG